MSTGNLTWGKKLGFGVGALGKDLCYAMISYYLMIYFTDAAELNPLFVGNLFLAARVWDAINDPFMGFIVDNTRTRWGKFKPWIVIGTITNCIVLVLIFRRPALEGWALYAYYSVMYILWGMTYTLMDIPYWSMLPSLSKTKEERDQMSVIPRIFASIAWLMMAAFAIRAVAIIGGGNDIKGYEQLAIYVAIIFLVTEFITVISVKDRSAEIAESGEKPRRTTMKDFVKVITSNDQLVVYIGVVLCFNMLIQIAGSVANYYFKYVAGEYELFSVFNSAAQFAEIGALFAFPVMSRMMSKKQVFAIASFVPVIGLMGLIVTGYYWPTDITIVSACGILYKFGSGLTLGATTVMLADVIDYGEYKLGMRNESIIASFQTLLVKTASAVAAWLVGVGLTVIGYQPNVAQTPATILGIRVIMGVIPSAVTIMAFVIYAWGFKLDGELLDKVMKAVNKTEHKPTVAEEFIKEQEMKEEGIGR